MADIKATLESLSSRKGRMKIYTWKGITENDNPLPLVVVGRADRSVQFFGNLGGGEITFEWTNIPETQDNAKYTAHKDYFGNVLAAIATLPFGASIAEASYQVRPRLTGAPSGADVDVHLLVIRTGL